MTIAIILVFLAVLIISLVIAADSHKKTDIFDHRALLFSGNTPFLAVFSTIGSFLSLNVIFSLVAVGMIGYGIATAIATATGLLGAYLFLGIFRKRFRSATANLGDDPLLVPKEMGVGGEWINLFLIGMYLLSLALEFALFREFLSVYDGDFPGFANTVLVAVGILCATYVVLGGYRGVVKTDFFQVSVFVVAGLFVVFLGYDQSDVVMGFFQNPRARAYPDTMATLVWITFTFAAFTSYPDVWIRNFGTIPSTNSRGRNFWIINIAALIAVFVPVIFLTAYSAQVEGAFDREYKVERAVRAYQELFLKSNGGLFLRLMIAAAFLCIFVTTINTWLIGVSQHAKSAPLLKSGRMYVFAPFLAALVAILASQPMNADTIYSVGLFMFPPLYLAMFVLFYRAFPFLQRNSSPADLIVCCVCGITTTAASLLFRWECRHGNAPYIIWLTLMVMALVLLLICGTKATLKSLVARRF